MNLFARINFHAAVKGKGAVLRFVIHKIFKEPPHVGVVNFLNVFLLPTFEPFVPRLELPQIVPMGFLGGFCAHQCVDVAVDGD
jgi:hypothetical protein